MAALFHTWLINRLRFRSFAQTQFGEPVFPKGGHKLLNSWKVSVTCILNAIVATLENLCQRLYYMLESNIVTK